MFTSIFFIFLILFAVSNAEFNDDFAIFVEENYGKRFLDALQRSDLGDNGSFGGKYSADEEIKKDPVIFIHGVSDMAGGKMHSLADKFRKRGYKSGELYATTYGNGNRNNPLSWTDYSMKCEHVKQVRTLILAVRYYTLRNVDVIAYSLGVPIARKAILGGNCVDSHEDLGSPLTSYIDTFVGVAGPNHGITLQIAGISIPGCVIGALPILPICSKVIGLYSGLCPLESQFLEDINDNEHYEGKHVFSIYSKTDNWIGYEVCGKITAKIPGEDSHKAYKRYNHDEVIEKTYEMQIQMIEKHSAFETEISNEELGVSRNLTVISRRRHNRNRQLDRRRNNDESVEEDDDDLTRRSRAKKREVDDYDYLDEPALSTSSKVKSSRRHRGSSSPSVSKSSIYRERTEIGQSYFNGYPYSNMLSAASGSMQSSNDIKMPTPYHVPVTTVLTTTVKPTTYTTKKMTPVTSTTTPLTTTTTTATITTRNRYQTTTFSSNWPYHSYCDKSKITDNNYSTSNNNNNNNNKAADSANGYYLTKIRIQVD